MCCWFPDFLKQITLYVMFLFLCFISGSFAITVATNSYDLFVLMSPCLFTFTYLSTSAAVGTSYEIFKGRCLDQTMND